ncbi:fimbrillin family protein [Bacteroides caecigallinarum]|uniref:fimbrillin family protein n=1 Tax=Bacteroides caecigallinarum TaxID=1411144 RepID=UPI001F262542|nr:fimbrillin family protein [Bacteroides caecigallinarum]MCF2592566.1 fimbrillin family protein [Bacteroides caecigallinarum]
MKKFNVSIRVLALTLLIGGLSSCSNRDNLLDENVTSEKEIILGEINELAFNGNILSRAVESTPVSNLEKFFEGKLICMYVDKVTGDNTVEALYDRRYLTVENNQLVMPEKLYYPSDGSVNIYVVAASPFSTASDANTAKPTQFYQYCQGWQPDSNSDFLYAKLENVTASSNPLSLQFKHLGTKISVAVTTPDNSKLTKIRVLNTRCQSIYNMDDGTYKETTDAVNGAIEMSLSNALNNNFTSTPINYASVYVAPQPIESGAQFIEFTFDGKTYFYTLAAATTFESEHEYKFNITLKEKDTLARSGSDMEVVCVNENF